MKAIKLRAHTKDEAMRQIAQHHFEPGMHILQLAHDDGCPAIRSQCDADCKPPCRPDFYLISPFSDARTN